MDTAFDLQRKPLFQVTCAKKDSESAYLIVAIHHAIADGWCRGISLNDFFRFLSGEITEIRTPDSAPEKGKYEKAVREILDKNKSNGLAYWKKLLEGYETKAEIPSFWEIPSEEQNLDDEILNIIDKETTSKFLALCGREGVSTASGAEEAWGLVLQSFNRKEDVVFAKVVSGRDNTEEDISSLVGIFINSIPVQVKSDEKTTRRGDWYLQFSYA